MSEFTEDFRLRIASLVNSRLEKAGLGDDADPVGVQAVLDRVSLEINNTFAKNIDKTIPRIELTIEERTNSILMDMPELHD